MLMLIFQALPADVGTFLTVLQGTPTGLIRREKYCFPLSKFCLLQNPVAIKYHVREAPFPYFLSKLPFLVLILFIFYVVH